MLSRTSKVSVVVAFVMFAMYVSATAHAAGWGSIKGRIIVDGKPAALAPINANKDQFCINAKPENNAVAVGKGNELENAVVYLRVGTGAPKVEINAEYDAAFKKPVVLDNKNCMFHPHVVVVRKDQTLDITNSDPVGHNTNIALLAFNQVVSSMGKVPVKVSQTATIPMPVNCNIHPWMLGYILSLDHPYAAVTGADGKFEIKNMPAGEHEFQFWHETGYLRGLAFKGGKTDARTGRAKLKIADGETLDLGDIKVPASSLKVSH